MQYAQYAAVMAIAVGLMSAVGRQPVDERSAVDAVLTDFHDAASDADFERYFNHFASNAVFLGTDPDERWTVDEFREYARPHFDAGTGWTYTMRERNISIDTLESTAWFDEVVVNQKYGACRGTGVLVKREGKWKIAQYNLTIPVPNEIALEVVEMIKRGGH